MICKSKRYLTMAISDYTNLTQVAPSYVGGELHLIKVGSKEFLAETMLDAGSLVKDENEHSTSAMGTPIVSFNVHPAQAIYNNHVENSTVTSDDVAEFFKTIEKSGFTTQRFVIGENGVLTEAGGLTVKSVPNASKNTATANAYYNGEALSNLQLNCYGAEAKCGATGTEVRYYRPRTNGF